MTTHPERFTIEVDATTRVSALLSVPAQARVCFLFAHGAGAGMEHPSMSTLAAALGDEGIGTLRYQFPYMERHSRRPDPPPLCHATVRAAVAAASQRVPALELIAGGRSFGGRMTSQAQALQPLPRVRGLAFVGFPLHPAGKPSTTRAQHLDDTGIPLLFLQGTRDELAELDLLRPVIERLGARATLDLYEHADHSFHVPAKSGTTDAEVRVAMARALATWAAHLS